MSRKHRRVSDYYLRFAAVTKDGRRLIIGYGEPSDLAHTSQPIEPPMQGVVLMEAYGGGELFFQFAFNADGKRLDRFAFNAPL